MVYDSMHHQMVLFGGEDSGGNALNDTWVYDGTTWTLLHPAASPTARLWHSMAFDAAHGTVVLFGGEPLSSPTPTYLGDTWLWNGTNWQEANSPNNPSGRQAPAMAFDAAQSNVVLFGGSGTSGVQQDTWTWNGSAWAAQTTAAVPARRFASMSYDPVHSQVVMFGGDNGSVDLGDTWTWAAGNWTKQTPAHSPSARSSQGQAYDSLRNLTVLFGASGGADTWTWNGTDWTQELTSASPPDRYYVNMAYDTEHSNLVLFGGLLYDEFGDVNDTWKLGYSYTQSWMLLTGATFGPPARFNAASTYQGNAAGAPELCHGNRCEHWIRSPVRRKFERHWGQPAGRHLAV
jgi:hypothetical protein